MSKVQRNGVYLKTRAAWSIHVAPMMHYEYVLLLHAILSPQSYYCYRRGLPAILHFQVAALLVCTRPYQAPGPACTPGDAFVLLLYLLLILL